MSPNDTEYPSYLINAINEMFSELGKEFLSSDLYEDRVERDSRAFNVGLRAYGKSLADEKFVIDLLLKVPDFDPYFCPYIEYYLQHEDAIKTIEEKILIQGGMHPEAARLILEEATKSITSKRLPRFSVVSVHKELIYGIIKKITPRRLFYAIGGAAIIALNAGSGISEPIIEISYALGSALFGKAIEMAE